ncbi:hypothetical protein EAF04_009333 [Stromatinia cepivora]|nr:hypothetical protein EAF04_009333 [Stromatinia cepivora]
MACPRLFSDRIGLWPFVRTRSSNLWPQEHYFVCSHNIVCWSFSMLSKPPSLAMALSRVIVGTGTAGVDLLVVIIINDLVQLYELPLWISATTICGTIGLMLGGPVGAAMTDHFGFRLTFGIELCAMAITLVVLYFTLHSPQAQPKKSEHATKKIEYLSATLLLVSVAVPLFALNLGGEIFAWNHPVVITMFCITPVPIALFYYTETCIASTPIVPKRFIQNRHVAIALACTLPIKFVFDQLRFSFGTYLEARSFGHESPFTDWALTCVYLGRAFGTIISGVLIKQYRRFKPFLQANIVVDLIVYLCFALGWMHVEQPLFAPVLAFIGATEGFAEGL